MITKAYPKTVQLKDGRSLVLRPLARDDFDQLHTFFTSLSEEDRLFLRHDVRDPEVVRKWTEDLDFERIVPLIALDDGNLVGSGSLHLLPHGWMSHVGHVRLVTARSHRHQGLGGLIARELVALANERNLEKLQAHVVDDNLGAVKMFEAIGFETAVVLKGMVKDQSGKLRNLAIMVNDVGNLSQLIDDWIQDSMLPSYRVPGGGA